MEESGSNSFYPKIWTNRKVMTTLETSSDKTASISKSGRVSEVRIIRPANEIFPGELLCRTYSFIKKSQKYDATFACRTSKPVSYLEVLMKKKRFASRDSISILSLLYEFRTVCDSNEKKPSQQGDSSIAL